MTNMSLLISSNAMLSKINRWLTSALELRDTEQDEKNTAQLAAAVLLLEVSRADFDISAQEQNAMIEELSNQFSLTEDKANALLQYVISEHEQYTSAHPFIRLINEELDVPAKQHLLEGLWRVAYADRKLDKYEEYHIRKIADWLYLSHADFIRIKNKIMRELDIPQ